MSKFLKLFLFFMLASCIKNQEIKLAQQPIQKPSLEFSFELLEKPAIITNDKCQIVDKPQIEIICMFPAEYDKETKNYLIMLNVIKQYQITDKYYKSIYL